MKRKFLTAGAAAGSLIFSACFFERGASTTTDPETAEGVIAGKIASNSGEDIILKGVNNSTWEVLRSTGNNLAYMGVWLNGWADATSYNLFSADINGDGRSDLLAKGVTGSAWHVALNTGYSFNPVGVWHSNWAGGTGYNLFVVDLDGNGQADLLAKEKNSGTWHAALSTGAQFWAAGVWMPSWAEGQNYDLFAADLNADGKADLLAKEKNTGVWHAALNTNHMFTAAGIWMPSWAEGQNYNLFVEDVTGDGRADLIAKEKATGVWHVAVNTGSGFTAAGIWVTNFATGTANELFVMDLDADGRADLVSKNRNTGVWSAALSNGNSFQHIGQVYQGYVGNFWYNLVGQVAP